MIAPDPPTHDQPLRAPPGDARSLAALRLALAARGSVRELYLGPDRAEQSELTTSADMCVIEAGRTSDDVLRQARYARAVLRDQGVIVFADRTRAQTAILHFLAELPAHRVYPLAHDLLVVEIQIDTLLCDRRVQGQVPRAAWRHAAQLGLVPAALRVAPFVRRLEWHFVRAVLILTAPRRTRHRPRLRSSSSETLFEVYTFVNDEAQYADMRASFSAAGFESEMFVRLSGDDDDPYRAIPRIGETSTARYPILCHQDVRLDQGADAGQLSAALEEIDQLDPHWTVAGDAGLTRSGRLVRRVVDPAGGFSGGLVPCEVVTLDENLLVFNRRAISRCSRGLSGFHLYGTDVCLNALSSGGSAYVVDFAVTHLSSGDAETIDYLQAKERLASVWNRRCLFRYVIAPTATLFLSRSMALRRVFGSRRALEWIGNALHDNLYESGRDGGSPLSTGPPASLD